MADEKAPHFRYERRAVVTSVTTDQAVQSFGEEFPTPISLTVTAEFESGSVRFPVSPDVRPIVGDPVHVVVELGRRA